MVIYMIKHWFCRIPVKNLTPTFAWKYSYLIIFIGVGYHIDLKLGVGLSENGTFTRTFAR